MGFAACILVAFLFVSVYKWENERVLDGGVAGEYVNGNASFLFCIDESGENDGLFYARGWVMRQGVETASVDTQVALIDADDHVWLMNTVMEKRDSVTQYYNDGVNYDNSGFYGSCKEKKLIGDETYEVGIVLVADGKKYLIKTGSMYQRSNAQS